MTSRRTPQHDVKMQKAHGDCENEVNNAPTENQGVNYWPLTAGTECCVTSVVQDVQQPQPQHADYHGYGDYHAQNEQDALAVREFVELYYRTLATAPHDAWRHFTVDAQYAHTDAQLIATGHGVRPAVGQRQIHAAIAYQQFAECRFCVRAVHVQRTPSGDHVALATGTVFHVRRPPYAFVQTFVVYHVAVTDQWAISNAMLHTGE